MEGWEGQGREQWPVQDVREAAAQSWRRSRRREWGWRGGGSLLFPDWICSGASGVAGSRGASGHLLWSLPQRRGLSSAAPLPMTVPQARPAGGSLGPRPAVLPTTRKSALPAGRPLTLPKTKASVSPAGFFPARGARGGRQGLESCRPPKHIAPLQPIPGRAWPGHPRVIPPPGLETRSTMFPTRAWHVWPSTHCGPQGQLPAPTWPTSQGCPELQC